jgi:IPT/TIG domain
MSGAGATTGKISVTTPSGTDTSGTKFTVKSGAAPTITSFSPTRGPVGTSVTIGGTNFTGATAVKFNGTTTTFTVNSATKITATVPAGATTGKISVTTPSGTDTSGTKFTVTGTAHSRMVSLHLRRHLRVRGTVTVDDGFSACASNVPVQIQRRRFGGATWRTIVRLSTDDAGRYSAHLRNLPGRYRARAVRVTLPTGDVCGRSTSGVKRYRL